jgi:hypothetical protein
MPGHLVEHVGLLVHAALLRARRGKHLRQRCCRRSYFNGPLVLEYAIHLGGSFVQQGLRLSFAEQDAYDGIAEGGG